MAEIFISYVREDRISMEAILNWKKQDESLNVEFNTDKLLIDEFKKLGQLTKPIIEKALAGLLDKSNAILILVGNDTHNKAWIEWEYNYAQNNKLKVGLIRVSNSTGAPHPIFPNLPIEKLTLKSLKQMIKDWGWVQ